MGLILPTRDKLFVTFGNFEIGKKNKTFYKWTMRIKLLTEQKIT